MERERIRASELIRLHAGGSKTSAERLLEAASDRACDVIDGGLRVHQLRQRNGAIRRLHGRCTRRLPGRQCERRLASDGVVE